MSIPLSPPPACPTISWPLISRRSPDWPRRAPSNHADSSSIKGRAMTDVLRAPVKPQKLVEHFKHGLNSPICLTWELTYACNLSCVHCLSSSGRRDPRELSTAECKAVIDELERMQVFYVN